MTNPANSPAIFYGILALAAIFVWLVTKKPDFFKNLFSKRNNGPAPDVPGPQPGPGTGTAPGGNPQSRPFPGFGASSDFAKGSTLALEQGGYRLQQLNYMVNKGELVQTGNARNVYVAKSFPLANNSLLVSGAQVPIVRPGTTAFTRDQALFAENHFVGQQNYADYLGHDRFHLEICDAADVDGNQVKHLYIACNSTASEPMFVYYNNQVVPTTSLKMALTGSHRGVGYFLGTAGNLGDSYFPTDTASGLYFFLSMQPFRIIYIGGAQKDLSPLHVVDR